MEFRQLAFPSANSVVLEGGVVVDPGPGVIPGPGPWNGQVVTTHWHSDHAGEVAGLQSRGARTAGSALEAPDVAAWTPQAGRAHWLRQSLSRYRIDRPLHPGDVIEAGATRWTALALPGHTAGQIGLHDPTTGILIAGDALHEADIGWLDLDADPAAMDQQERTLERIAALAPRLVLPGHGPAFTGVAEALTRARRRLAGFRADPTRAVFHAAKRILTHALMTDDGIAAAEFYPYLDLCPWFHSLAARLGLAAPAFEPVLLAEMLRSGAAAWDGDFLVATGDYAGRGQRRAALTAKAAAPPCAPATP